MAITLIACMDLQGHIGYKQKLPWHIPEDLKHFQETTMGKPILMGRRTFESLPGLLPGRHHFVLTRQPDWHADGVEIVRSLSDIVTLGEQINELFVIGGGDVFEQCLPLAKHMVLTVIDREYPGDVKFPKFNPEEWQCVRLDPVTTTDGINLTYQYYRRVTA